MAKRKEEITNQHLIDTLRRVEIMVGAVQQALKWRPSDPRGKRSLTAHLGPDAVILAGLTRSGCRFDGSCARLRPPVPAAPPKRPKKKPSK